MTEKTKSSLALLLASGLALSCSSSSGAGTGIVPVTGGGGTSAAGGSPSSSSSGSGGASAVAGASSGGTGGQSVGGVAPVNGMCVSGALKHPDGLCYCQPASLTTCPDGCFDPTSDADHCGDCTTKCGATQACSASKCGGTPTALVPAAAGCGSIHLAVAAGTLYWTDQMHGTVKSIPIAGGTAAPVASGQMAPTLISVNGTSAYWLDTGSKMIMKATAGGAATSVATTTDTIGGFTLSADGNTLYFSHGTTVSKTSTTPGGTVTEVGHEDTGIPRALSVEGNLIGYPTDGNGDIDIMTMVDGTPAVCASESATVVNSNCLRVARSQGALNFDNMYILSAQAYWGNEAIVQTASTSDTSGLDTTVAGGSPDAQKLTAFSITGTTVYFADDTGGVYKAPLMQNATVSNVARAQMGITAIVADDTNAYWANGDCSIMSVPLK